MTADQLLPLPRKRQIIVAYKSYRRGVLVGPIDDFSGDMGPATFAEIVNRVNQNTASTTSTLVLSVPRNPQSILGDLDKRCADLSGPYKTCTIVDETLSVSISDPYWSLIATITNKSFHFSNPRLPNRVPQPTHRPYKPSKSRQRGEARVTTITRTAGMVRDLPS